MILPYKPRFFDPRELVPPKIWHRLGQSSILLFDPDILMIADILRREIGPLICNDWYRGGRFSLRGFRPFDSKIGAPRSMHKFGRALDLVPLNQTAEEAREFIRLTHQRKFFQLRRMESEGSWIHLDTYPTGKAELIEFNPET